MIFDIILQAKKLFFGFALIEILFRYIKINDLERSRCQENLDQKEPELEP